MEVSPVTDTSKRIRYTGGRQAGSVLAEFIVVTAAVLLPLAIMLPLLFKYMENRQYVEQAARYAAWERTAYYLNAPSGSKGAPVKGAAEIRHEVDNRILADGQVPIKREQREQDQTEERNPMLYYWQRHSQSMIPLYESRNGGALEEWAEVSVENQKFKGWASSKATAAVERLLTLGNSSGTFNLERKGQFRSEVTLQLAGLDYLPELDNVPIQMRRSNTLVADGWGQNPDGAESAARSLNPVARWGDGALTGALNDVLKVVSFVPLVGSISKLETGKVDIDAVPCINLGENTLDGRRSTPACSR